MPTRTYRCLNCLEETVDRGYDVSHFRVTCESCGEFGRFVHEGVYQQFEAFEADPPADLDWERLDRMEKFLVAEKLVRKGKTLEDFEVESLADGDEADDEETGEAVAADADDPAGEDSVTDEDPPTDPDTGD